MRNPIYTYKEYVDKDHIEIKEKPGFRYLLFVPYKEPSNNKYLLVIMRNPSKANKAESDKTINNVLSFCHNQYAGVYFVNLYPYYETDSTKLKEFIECASYDSEMNQNKQVVEEVLQLEEIDSVIVAWGTNSTGVRYEENYKQTINVVLGMIRKYKKPVYAMRFQSSRNPWHPRNWEDGFQLELYRWPD